jgi:hypothetical protein
MKTIVLLGLVASLLAAPGIAHAGTTDKLCGPDAPEGYKRPGGYCDIIRGHSFPGSSTAGESDPAMPPPAEPVEGVCGVEVMVCAS